MFVHPAASRRDKMPTSVVTGATGGIGLWIALGLMKAGHRVIIVGRDAQRGYQALNWLRAHAPASGAELELADLALLAQTRALARRILDRHAAIDVLVNNAGVFSAHREETREGHERVLAVNYLSPFVLTEALLPALGRGAGSRIVNVGSSTADRARLDLADLERTRRWGMVRAYSQSKLALGVATMNWSRRLRHSGVTANLVHPGTVATGLVRSKGAIGLAWRIMAPFCLTEEQGADTPLHVALSPNFAGVTGAYVKKRRMAPPNGLMLDASFADRLRAATEALVRP